MKNLKLALLFFITLLSMQAQEIKYGVKSGLNYVTVIEEGTSQFNPKLSFHAGGFLELVISKQFSLQPELIYSSQGAKSEIIESLSTNVMNVFTKSKINLKLNYINMPILSKFYVFKRLSLELGPQIGFLVSSKTNIDETTTTTTTSLGVSSVETESRTTNLNDIFKTVEFGATMGLGYRFNNGLNLGARYNWGWSNIIDDNYLQDEDSEIQVKNDVFQLSLGFTF